jgi:hypothetical protein
MIDLHYAPTPNGWKTSIMLEGAIRRRGAPEHVRTGGEGDGGKEMTAHPSW